MINKVVENTREYATKAYRKAQTRAPRATVYAPAYQPIMRKNAYTRFKEELIDVTKPARTIFQARKIAQALGVGELRIDDLALANYINEGLYEYTRITKKKLPKIDIITQNPVDEFREHTIMSTGILDKKRFIYVNRDCIIRDNRRSTNFDIEDLRNILHDQDSKLTTAQKNCIRKAIENPKRLTPEEQRAICHLTHYIHKTISSFESCYISILNSPSTKKIAKQAGIEIVPLSTFRTFSKKEKTRYIDNLLNAGCKMSYNNYGRFHSLFHELGHIHHENKIGTRRLDKMYIGFDGDLFSTSSTPFTLESTNRFANKQRNHLMTGYLSDYAMTCPGEFVAEMYAGTLDGNRYCKELRKMYRRYHGPHIPFFTQLRNYVMSKMS